MSTKILWLDDEIYEGHDKVMSLREHSYAVTLARDVVSAERLLSSATFDLLILDEMIPVDDDVEGYEKYATGIGQETGLLFLRRMRETIKQKAVKVVVITVLEEGLLPVQEFEELGLQRERLISKSEVADTRKFLARLQEILSPDIN